DRVELRLEPRPASPHLALPRLLVDPPLAALLEREVLHRVRHVDARPVEPGLGERVVEHAARRPDEGPPLPVLVVPRLLPYHDDAGRGVALAEDGLRGPEVERAALAPLRGPRQAREVFPGGKEVLGPRRPLFGHRRRPAAPS